MRNVSNKSSINVKTPVLGSINFISNIVPFMRQCGKILYSEAGHRWSYGACALHNGYLSLQTHTQVV